MSTTTVKRNGIYITFPTMVNAPIKGEAIVPVQNRTEFRVEIKTEAPCRVNRPKVSAQCSPVIVNKKGHPLRVSVNGVFYSTSFTHILRTFLFQGARASSCSSVIFLSGLLSRRYFKYFFASRPFAFAVSIIENTTALACAPS